MTRLRRNQGAALALVAACTPALAAITTSTVVFDLDGDDVPDLRLIRTTAAPSGNTHTNLFSGGQWFSAELEPLAGTEILALPNPLSTGEPQVRPLTRGTEIRQQTTNWSATNVVVLRGVWLGVSIPEITFPGSSYLSAMPIQLETDPLALRSQAPSKPNTTSDPIVGVRLHRPEGDRYGWLEVRGIRVSFLETAYGGATFDVFRWDCPKSGTSQVLAGRPHLEILPGPSATSATIRWGKGLGSVILYTRQPSTETVWKSLTTGGASSTQSVVSTTGSDHRWFQLRFP